MASKFTFRQFQALYPDDDACLLASSTGSTTTTMHARMRRCRSQVPQDHWPSRLCMPRVRAPLLPLRWHSVRALQHAADDLVPRDVPDDRNAQWRVGERASTPTWRDLQMRMADRPSTPVDLMARGTMANNPGPLSGHVEWTRPTSAVACALSKATARAISANKSTVFGMVARGGIFAVRCPERATRNAVADHQSQFVLGSTSPPTPPRATRTLSKHGYDHGAVNHMVNQWKSGIHHTNAIEGFWSHLKRGLVSTHVSVSRQHLPKYIGEFSFRYNNRDDPSRDVRAPAEQISA